jgi:hypothetical protein
VRLLQPDIRFLHSARQLIDVLPGATSAATRVFDRRPHKTAEHDLLILVISTLRWKRRKEALGKVSASMAEWSARATRRRLNMNANATTGIRELTAQELDHVTGGEISTGGWNTGWGVGAAAVFITGAVMAVAGAFWDWLFG